MVVESYIADERSVRESCQDDVAKCDLYIGIIGRRYGFVPGATGTLHHRARVRRGAERQSADVVFIKEDDHIKGPFWDAVTNENPPALIESFRRRVSSGGEGAPRATFFKTPG